MVTEPFLPEEASLDNWVKFIGGIYLATNKENNPSDLWMQVVNDSTILAEHVRKGEHDEAEARIVKLFGWIAAFIGKYLYLPLPVEPKDDPIKEYLRKKAPTYTGLDESYAKWILEKYPGVCSKCALPECHCCVYRKVVEQRKEKPTEYDALAATFHANREKARRPFTKVENKPTKAATEFLKKPIDELIDTFIKIYGSGHYDTEMWKLAAHLHEEIGEAAVQIMNIAELTWHRTHGLGFSNVLSKAVARKRRERVDLNPKLLKKLEMQKTDDALFDFLRDGAVSKLKEELADVFTWLTAMLHKIREDRRSEAEPHFWKLLNENFATRGKTPGPWCRACGAFECEHDCLVTTVVAGLLTELNRKD